MKHEIPDKFQFSFGKFLSTETTLLIDISMPNDSGESTVMVLLDLMSDFDTVEDRI